MHGQDEGDRLLDVVKDAPSETDGRDDGREIIVQQYERRGLTGHVRSATAHGDADVRRLQRRGVVDPVAGHGDDLPVCLQRGHDAQLLLGNDTGKDLHVADLAGQFLVRHAIEFGTGDDLVAIGKPRLSGDALGGQGIVTRDHHHAHTGGTTFGDRGRHGGPQRVLEPKQAHELEQQVVMLLGEAFQMRDSPRDPEHPKAPGCQGRYFS